MDGGTVANSEYNGLCMQHITYRKLFDLHLFHHLSPLQAWYHIPEGTSLYRHLHCFVVP